MPSPAHEQSYCFLFLLASFTKHPHTQPTTIVFCKKNYRTVTLKKLNNSAFSASTGFVHVLNVFRERRKSMQMTFQLTALCNARPTVAYDSNETGKANICGYRQTLCSGFLQRRSFGDGERRKLTMSREQVFPLKNIAY